MEWRHLVRAYLSLTELCDGTVPEVGMHFNLVGDRSDTGVAEQVLRLLDTEVADSNRLHQAVIDKLLHIPPCFLQGCMFSVASVVHADKQHSIGPSAWLHSPGSGLPRLSYCGRPLRAEPGQPPLMLHQPMHIRQRSAVEVPPSWSS